MKRYQIEATRFELDGTESHKVLYTSNGVSTARAYLAGFTDANDWKNYDIINLLDTAHPRDSDLHLIDSQMQVYDIIFATRAFKEGLEVYVDGSLSDEPDRLLNSLSDIADCENHLLIIKETL